MGRLTFALQALEVGADLAGVLIAKLSILFQAVADEALQFRRQRGIQSFYRRRRATQDGEVEDKDTVLATVARLDYNPSRRIPGTRLS